MLSAIEDELNEEIGRLRGQLNRERRARHHRSEVQQLLGQTTSMVTREGVAEVIARGISDIFDVGWAAVGFLDGDETIRFVFGPKIPRPVADDWPVAPLSSAIPMADVLRGEVERIELVDRSQHGRWPEFEAESERAHIESFLAIAVPRVARSTDPDARPIAVIGVAWPEPHSMDDNEREVFEELVAAAAPAFERAGRTETDAAFARTLQRSLLPPSIPDIDGLEVASLYVPSSSGSPVGGDWYDVVALDDHRFALVVGDVVGHNMRAAAEMGQVRHVLAAGLMLTSDPSESLQLTDRYFFARDENTMATAIVIVFDSTTATIEIASAGHLPPVVAEVSTAARLISVDAGPPLGSGLGSGYSKVERSFPAGSLLVAMTDGVVERRDETIDDSLAALCDRIDALSSGLTDHTVAPVSVDAFVDGLVTHIDEIASSDDAAALVVRRITGSPRAARTT